MSENMPNIPKLKMEVGGVVYDIGGNDGIIMVHPKDYVGAENSDVLLYVFAPPVGTLSYQWYLSKNGGASWASLGNGYRSNYVAFDLTASRNGYMYRCQVTSSLGWTENSRPATVRIGAQKSVPTPLNYEVTE